MSTKFGLLIDFNLSNTVASTIRKPKVALSGRVLYLENPIWRHVSASDGPIWMKFGSLMQNSMPIAVI